MRYQRVVRIIQNKLAHPIKVAIQGRSGNLFSKSEIFPGAKFEISQPSQHFAAILLRINILQLWTSRSLGPSHDRARETSAVDPIDGRARIRRWTLSNVSPSTSRIRNPVHFILAD